MGIAINYQGLRACIRTFKVSLRNRGCSRISSGGGFAMAVVGPPGNSLRL